MIRLIHTPSLKGILFPLAIILSFGLNAQISNTHSEHLKLSKEGYFEQQMNEPVHFDLSNANALKTSNPSCKLTKTVFGYHPSWVGSAYHYYDWNLISDLCYFSYEVAPSSGLPTTTNEWETAAVIDSAQAHGVRIHLCVTLFSGHATFFNSTTSQQTLIEQIIQKMQLRNAIGVNIDVEALPSSLAQEYNSFLVQLATQVHQNIPGSVVSIAAPAVDWGNELNIPLLKQHLDLFMVMTYDYYWNGSNTAGPVSPLYAMDSDYNYSVARSISWYLSQGVDRSKILMGVPYYGRDWPVTTSGIPANTSGNATALTYRLVRNNNSIYNSETYRWETSSRCPYYSYYINNWQQCFIDNDYSLGIKYDLVNSLNLGGIGVWALGYDKGYQELWRTIEMKFTSCIEYACTDSIYDNGGPSFNYYNNEDYTLHLTSDSSEKIRLDFVEFDLENEFDYLQIYDGPDTTALLMGRFTGQNIPNTIIGNSNNLTLHFHSDGQTTSKGWKAIRKCPTAATSKTIQPCNTLKILPNPVERGGCIKVVVPDKIPTSMYLIDQNSNMYSCNFRTTNGSVYEIDINNIKNSGSYVLQLLFSDGNTSSVKVIIL